MNDKDHILQQNEKIRVLELQNQILSIHWEESPDGILVVDSDWKMVSYNQRFVDMWGIAQHILDAKDDRASIQSILDKLCHPKQFLDKVEYLMAHPTEKSQEILELKNGCFFDRSSTPIVGKDHDDCGRIWFFRDITEKIKQEEERLERARQQEEFKKLDSLKTMAGAIAHRFNNTMMAVQGNLELMAFTLPADSNEHKMATDAAQAASEAAQIGSMMLSYVGQQPLKLQNVPLETVTRESVATVKNLLHPSISLQFTPPDQPLYCSIDQKLIKKVIVSIITNAIESLNDKAGTIEVSFGRNHFAMDSLPVTFQNDNLKDGNYAFCQIKDCGHGISQKNLLRIFEPFFTTRFVGRGLGLALTVGTMQSHYGAITVESTLAHGTTVRVLLPSIDLSPQQTIASEDDSYQRETIQLSGKILLADDEKMVLDVGRKMLQMLGFTVYTAINGHEAVDKILNQNISFCAVVLDVSMPEMDGIEAMNAIRNFDPTLPILLSSGFSEGNLSFKEGGEDKPDGFLGKPFQLSDMRSSLEKLLS